MVQFGLKLQDNVVPKWADAYLDYKGLKGILSKRAKAWEAEVLANAKANQRYDSPKRGNERSKLLMKVAKASTGNGSPIKKEEPFKSLVLSEVDRVETFFTRILDNLVKELSIILQSDSCQPYLRHLTIDSSDGDRFDGILSLSDNDPELGDSVHKRSIRRTLSRTISVLRGMRMSLSSIADVKEIDSLQRAMSDMYRDMTLLRNFAIINYTGCVKIVKKHDKKMDQAYRKIESDAAYMDATIKPVRPISKEILVYVHKQEFYTCKRLDEVTSTCEREFANMFCGGDLSQARGLLLPQKMDESVEWGVFQLGYHLGLAAVLAFWIVWDSCEAVLKEQADVSIVGQPAFRVYRGLAGLLLLHWAWAFSTLVWTRTRINFIYLFELDPRRQSSPIVIFNDAAVETVILLANLLAYYKTEIGAVRAFFPAGYFPLALCLYTIKKLFFPWEIKKEVWIVLGRVCCAPFAKVEFFATYCADVLTSSVKTILDITWAFGYFFSGNFLLKREEWIDSKPTSSTWETDFLYSNVLVPALCILPLWLRFQQCLRRYHDTHKRFPNLANALKYAMAQTVSIFAVFRPQESNLDVYNGIWLFLYVISSLYSFWWDVYQDWGLGHFNYKFLNDRKMHTRLWVYYSIIGLDFLLRFIWLYSFIPPGISTFFIMPNYFTTVVMILEIFRRTLWGFLRLENEHLRNTEGYRSIDVVPLHFRNNKGNERRSVEAGPWIVGEVMLVGLGAVGVTIAAVVLARDSGKV